MPKVRSKAKNKRALELRKRPFEHGFAEELSDRRHRPGWDYTVKPGIKGAPDSEFSPNAPGGIHVDTGGHTF